ncbi:hypothetical protein ScPMuIL_011805 [Solemya velum]
MTLKGLDPNFCDPDSGETPLSLAVTLDKQKCREVILSLVSAGAHLDFRTKEGFTAMHKAAIIGSTDSVKTLLDLGSSPHYRDAKGLTPLYQNVCKGGNPVCAEILLYEQSVTGIQDEQGWCEIHHACRQGLAQHLEHLLYYGADINVQNASGNTPLHVCAVNNMDSCARTLLFRGVKKEVYNYSSQTAYQVAIMAGNQELADLIEAHRQEDSVPFKDMPKFSSRRRCVKSETFQTLVRCRSDPKLNYNADEDKYYSSSLSSQSLQCHINYNKSDSMASTGSPGYYSDSPRSLSISSNSSGPVISVGDHGFWEGQTNGREGWFPSDHIQEVRMRHRQNNGPYDNMQLQRNTLATLVQPDREYEPRTVVLHKGPEGYGFVLRGAKAEARKGELDFHPSAEFPALQYLDSVDPGSKSDRAGLKSGDFILEINGDNVVRASHDQVVHLIRTSGNSLALKVVTVKPVNRQQDWFIHQDGCMTVPSRKKAPEPPQRDPHTSLSFSKAKSKSITNGLEEIEALDQAIEDDDSVQKRKLEEKKTASIKARHSAKRVSCVELENIGVYDQDNKSTSNNEKDKPVVSMPKDYMSPSELRIKKYHKKEVGSLERSHSTPDLQDSKPGETLYATPMISSGDNRTASMMANGPAPDYPGSDLQKHVYAVPSETKKKLWVVNNSRPSTMKYARPVGPPPLPSDSPPGLLSRPTPKRQAPAPPPDTESGILPKTEVVAINRKRGSVYSNSSAELPMADTTPPMMEESPYESSFRPGTNAKLTNEPGSISKSHQRNTSVGRVQPHFDAQILVTADVHVSNNKRGQPKDEPVPDYDSDSDDEIHHNKALTNRSLSRADNPKVTVISIANDCRGNSVTKSEEYQRKELLSQIARHQLPPQDVRASHYGVPMKSSPKEHAREHSYERFGLDTSKTSVDNTSSVSASSVHSQIMDSVKQGESYKTPSMATPLAPPIPQAPPPPPLPSESPPVHRTPSQNAMQGEPRTTSTDTVKVEAGSILAAVQARKARMDTSGPRMVETKPTLKKDDWKSQMESNQAAILAAVAKRRSVLENQTNNSVVENIETRLQKTKKLQSAKYYFSSDTINSTGKEVDTSLKVAPIKTGSEIPTSESSKGKIEKETVISTDSKKDIPTGARPVSNKVGTVNMEQKNKISVSKNNSAIANEKSVINKPKQIIEAAAASKAPAAGADKKTSDTKEAEAAPHDQASDFLAMAEKARQDYLRRKSTESLSSSKSSLESPKSVKKEVPVTKKTDLKGVVATKSMKDSVIMSSTVPIKDRIKNLQKGKPSIDGPQTQQNKKLPAPSGESKLAVSPKLNHSNVHNGTSSSQLTSLNTSLPPPPEFGDSSLASKMVQLEIVPPPINFDMGTDTQHYSMSFSPEDSASIVSSLSTMSTASSDHGDIWHSKQANNFEDLIAPPPPGFDDKNNNHINNNMAIVIPPPPEFGDLSNKGGQKTTKRFDTKPVDSWLCNDVLDWLDSLKMPQYKSRFQERCINGKKLIGLSRNDYIELGVTQVGHRMSLERSIKKATLFHTNNSTYVEKL